jgi:hypothetical protein
MSKLTLTIDGSRARDFKTFIDEFNRVYSGFDVHWGGHLDAFNDYLAWPDEKYELIWEQSELSRAGLGYGEMVKWLEERVQHCHPSNVSHMRERLEEAKLGRGQTMFDLLVEIIERNRDYVQLRLE